MFKRSKRISRAAFPEALRTGRKASSPHFLVVFPKTRVGYAVVVPKKVARLATTRHKIKRRVLAVLRDLPSPHSAIVFPRAHAIQLTYNEIKEELRQLLA